MTDPTADAAKLLHEASHDAVAEPNPYCTSVPTLLRAWDATALRSYMECPRKYYYQFVEGWRGTGSVHLEFGRLYHGALEQFDKAIAAGQSKDDATDAAMQYALEQSYSEDVESKPVYWGGTYETVWNCTDPGPPFKSGPRKGQPNPGKACPNAQHARLGQKPGDTCPLCAKPLTDRIVWAPLDTKKNRETLIRAVAWYCDTQPQDGGVRALVFPDGRAAVELSFALPLPFNTPDGEPYLLTGNLDGLATIGGENVVRERKTTYNSLGQQYFDRYAPDVQVDTYDLASWLLYPQLNLTGVLMEATQTGVAFTRFQRQFVVVPAQRREEWFSEIQYWIKRAEADAISGVWPKNTASCSANGGCPFRRICRLAPTSRAMFLPEHFEKQLWNPLATR